MHLVAGFIVQNKPISTRKDLVTVSGHCGRGGSSNRNLRRVHIGGGDLLVVKSGAHGLVEVAVIHQLAGGYGIGSDACAGVDEGGDFGIG